MNKAATTEDCGFCFRRVYNYTDAIIAQQNAFCKGFRRKKTKNFGANAFFTHRLQRRTLGFTCPGNSHK